MKKNLIELNKIQATIVLENLDLFVDKNKELENDPSVENEYRKGLREERLEAEMLIKQIEALEWD